MTPERLQELARLFVAITAPRPLSPALIEFARTTPWSYFDLLPLYEQAVEPSHAFPHGGSEEQAVELLRHAWGVGSPTLPMMRMAVSMLLRVGVDAGGNMVFHKGAAVGSTLETLSLARVLDDQRYGRSWLADVFVGRPCSCQPQLQPCEVQPWRVFLDEAKRD